MSEAEQTGVVDPLLGASLGDYQVLEFIGEGGMGVVYRGIQPVVKKRVAIKVLRPEVAADAVAAKKLLAEAEAVNAIGHRGIVDIFTHGQLPDGRPYIVMEYLNGEPLDCWLARVKRPTVLEALEVLVQICAPLAAAHRSSIIHRDLKPSNVFLCTQPDGERFVKLLDFGLAKRGLDAHGKTPQTWQTEVSGTPYYMAPEQARALSVSPRTDIYALGVIAFELLTGLRPFQGETPMDVMVAHVSQRPLRPRILYPDMPRALELLLLAMLEKSPQKRPRSVEEVREQFEAIAASLGAQPRSVSGPQQSVVRLSNRSRKLVGGLSLLVLGIALALVVVSAESDPAPEPPQPIAQLFPPAPEPAPKMVPERTAAGDDASPLPPETEELTPLARMVAPPSGEPPAPLPPPARPTRVRPPSSREPLSVKSLTARISRFENRAAKHPNLDPSALVFLPRFRIEAAAADTPARRIKLSRALDEWERSFLAR